jgi:hypothetical protein
MPTAVFAHYCSGKRDGLTRFDGARDELDRARVAVGRSSHA